MSKGAKPDAWMPLFVGDYLADTARLTTEQHGAYLLLIMDYWRNGPPPADDAVLAQIAHLDRKAWAKHRAAVLRFFREEDGSWRHKRVDQELAAAQGRSDKAAERASVAAQARWGKRPAEAPSNAPGNAPSMPEALLEECPSPSPSPIRAEAKASSLDGAKVRATRKCPAAWVPSQTVFDVGSEEGFSPGEIDRELSKMRDHTFGSTRSDWDATARNWLKTAADRKPKAPANGQRPHNQPGSAASRSEDRMQRIISGAAVAARIGGYDFGG